MKIRKIKKNDNPHIANVIKSVMTEYGAFGEGFSIHDTEVKNMYESYNNPGSMYFVIEDDVVKGGAGIGPLVGESRNYCELKKMYILKDMRGKGVGKQLIELCLESAKKLGYRFCYIETFNSMNEAYNLYLKYGFKPISNPLGNTGHFSCDRWLLKKLDT
jgi:putative acetyltransferase